jgi:hypothetical protein
MPIRGYIGLLGTGKTLGAVTDAKDLHDRLGLAVLANCYISFGERVNPLDILNMELEKCVLIIDEAYTVLDARVNSEAGRLYGYFLKQSRKRDVYVFFTSQRFMDVDIRLRQITAEVYYCEKSETDKCFYYTVIEGGAVQDVKKLTFKEAKKIYPLYDTMEIIVPMGVRDDVTNMEDLKTLVEKCPNQVTFVTLARKTNPFMDVNVAASLYALLKAKQYVLAETLIRPQKKRAINREK